MLFTLWFHGEESDLLSQDLDGFFETGQEGFHAFHTLSSEGGVIRSQDVDEFSKKQQETRGRECRPNRASCDWKELKKLALAREGRSSYSMSSK
ncbi:hypothetical protein GOP47_0017643 [Adiantum capillus-veneris]|uniref:Uncharacterized protein n=1 Tax=Adiantum capillus-veneris TaxID=13818 RepID=A0A9D4UFU5_ADICA|nr:hypothetical protein GOP47_0017643 [Adiantum capillus-veneris]